MSLLDLQVEDLPCGDAEEADNDTPVVACVLDTAVVDTCSHCFQEEAWLVQPAADAQAGVAGSIQEEVSVDTAWQGVGACKVAAVEQLLDCKDHLANCQREPELTPLAWTRNLASTEPAALLPQQVSAIEKMGRLESAPDASNAHDI